MTTTAIKKGRCTMVDEQRVGGVCNSLNALSSLHRHKYSKEPKNKTSRNTSEIMDVAQRLIWEMWDELKLQRGSISNETQNKS